MWVVASFVVIPFNDLENVALARGSKSGENEGRKAPTLNSGFQRYFQGFGSRLSQPKHRSDNRNVPFSQSAGLDSGASVSGPSQSSIVILVLLPGNPTLDHAGSAYLLSSPIEPPTAGHNQRDTGPGYILHPKPSEFVQGLELSFKRGHRFPQFRRGCSAF